MPQFLPGSPSGPGSQLAPAFPQDPRGPVALPCPRHQEPQSPLVNQVFQAIPVDLAVLALHSDPEGRSGQMDLLLLLVLGHPET